MGGGGRQCVSERTHQVVDHLEILKVDAVLLRRSGPGALVRGCACEQGVAAGEHAMASVTTTRQAAVLARPTTHVLTCELDLSMINFSCTISPNAPVGTQARQSVTDTKAVTATRNRHP